MIADLPDRHSPGPIRPRTLVYQGKVEVRAFCFDAGLIGLVEARRRILALWSPGAVVYRPDPEGPPLILRLPATMEIDCRLAPGLPLVQRNPSERVLFSAPLGEDEREALAAQPDSAVLVREGIAVVLPLREDAREDPADWLDLRDWEPVPMVSLGALPADPSPSVEEIAFDPREKLEGVPPQSPEGARFLALLGRAEQQKQEGAQDGKHPGRPLAARLQEGAAAIADRLATLGAAVRSLFPRRSRRPASSGAAPARSSSRTASGGSAAGPDALARAILFVLDPLLYLISRLPNRRAGFRDARIDRPPKGWTEKLVERLSGAARGLSARLAMLSGLARVLGYRQARYIGRMMQMFQEDDLGEALRHAIPLGGPAGLERCLPSLGLPSRRADLTISPHQASASSSISGGPALFEELRRLYRRAFERLKEQGRIEEAAFVLAELLHANEEAVAFLEAHGKLRLAAEMAEARGLPPGLVVRQWFLARDGERAILLARRTGAFADAVLRLERTHKEEAEKLRLLWAHTLAEAGDYARAVDVAWPLETARLLAREWLERGLAVGGVAGARLLARKLELAPDTFEEVRRLALVLLEDEGTELAPARFALAEALRKGKRSDGAAALARAAVRALLRDAGNGYARISPAEFARIVEFTGDGALRADVPPLPEITPRSLLTGDTLLEREVAPGDSGTLPLYDAALLPDGKMVVALGEVGVRLLARDGRTLVHWDQPAHHLVLSDRGDRAIAVAPRGEASRLARIDFVTRRAAYWCDASLSEWAPDYDGSLWFVASGRDFAAIDATSAEWKAVWSRAGIGPAVEAIARSPSHCSLLVTTVENADQWGNAMEPWLKREKWSYTLRPGPVLQTQVPCPVAPSDAYSVDLWRGTLKRGISSEGDIVELYAEPIESKGFDSPITPALDLWADGWGEPWVGLTSAPIRTSRPAIVGEWVSCTWQEHDRTECYLFDRQSPQVRAYLALQGNERAVCRLTRHHLTVTDDRGRLLVLDLERGQWLRDLRLSL